MYYKIGEVQKRIVKYLKPPLSLLPCFYFFTVLRYCYQICYQNHAVSFFQLKLYFHQQTLIASKILIQEKFLLPS